MAEGGEEGRQEGAQFSVPQGQPLLPRAGCARHNAQSLGGRGPGGGTRRQGGGWDGLQRQGRPRARRVGRADHRGASRLAKHGGQVHAGQGGRVGGVSQDGARADGGELVCVADEHEGRVWWQRRRQGSRQWCIQQRGFIHQDGVDWEGGVGAAAEDVSRCVAIAWASVAPALPIRPTAPAPAPAVQQAVQRDGGRARALGQAQGGPPCGGGERDAQPEGAPAREDGRRHRRLARARPPRHHQGAARGGRGHRGHLARGQGEAGRGVVGEPRARRVGARARAAASGAARAARAAARVASAACRSGA